jgi:hypothetical protein
VEDIWVEAFLRDTIFDVVIVETLNEIEINLSMHINHVVSFVHHVHNFVVAMGWALLEEVLGIFEDSLNGMFMVMSVMSSTVTVMSVGMSSC